MCKIKKRPVRRFIFWLLAERLGALQGTHGKPNTFSSYTTRRDTAEDSRCIP